MSSHVYTLPELVDLALKTPEIGAVNFNILRVLLHKILSECKLQNVTGEWKPATTPTPLFASLEDEQLPDHPIVKRIAAEKERTAADTVVKEVVIEAKTFTTLEERSIQTDFVSPDTVSVRQISESPIISEQKDEEGVPEVSELKKKPLFSVEISKKDPKEDELTKKPQISREASESTAQKDIIADSNIRQIWELKKLVKRVEGVEEELNSIVYTIDELREWKEKKTERFRLLEGEGLKSGYSGPTVGREEFEDIVHELGEALALIGMRQKQHKESCEAVSQDIINKMSLRPTQEEMNLSTEELNKKLNTLSKAIRSMQKLVKDIIYTETCGTTKCLSCKRKAHLPLSETVIDHKKNFHDDSTIRNMRNASVTKSCNASHDLRFTTACYGRIIEEDDKRKVCDAKISEALDTEEKAKPSEEPTSSKRIINLDVFEVPNLVRDFAPLRPFPDRMRRGCFHVPIVKPKKGPITISVGTSESSNLIKKYPIK